MGKLIELKEAYTNDITNLSCGIKKSIETTIDYKITYETFSTIMKFYNLDFFVTEEISSLVSKEKERIGTIIDYDYFNKKQLMN